MAKLIIKANRDGYNTAQCGDTMTVLELMEVLSGFDDDMPVYLSHDNGYTYGALRAHHLDDVYDDD